MEVRTKVFHKGRANTSLSLHLVHDGDSGSQEKWAHEKVSACVTTFKSSAEPHHHYQPPSTILFEQETMFVGCVFLQCKHMLSSICCLIEAVSFPVPPANQPAFLCSPALGGGGMGKRTAPSKTLDTIHTSRHSDGQWLSRALLHKHHPPLFYCHFQVCTLTHVFTMLNRGGGIKLLE